MESFNLKGNVYDPLRKMAVSATPEEIVRQKLILQMIQKLGFPKELLCVEKQLSELPHLQNVQDLPTRRADIICFAKGIHKEYSLFPLLLIECKEGKVGDAAREQALGYNHYVQAPFVAIAGFNHVELVYPQKLDFLPLYKQMLEAVCL